MGGQRCSVCGCSEDDPCRLSTGDACTWWDAARSICSKPSCITRAAALPASAQRTAKRFGRKGGR